MSISRPEVRPGVCQEGPTGEVLADDDDGLVADERRAAAHHLMEHGAEGVEIGARGDFAAGGRLGGMWLTVPTIMLTRA